MIVSNTTLSEASDAYSSVEATDVQSSQQPSFFMRSSMFWNNAPKSSQESESVRAMGADDVDADSLESFWP